jgi:LysM repeat protein
MRTTRTLTALVVAVVVIAALTPASSAGPGIRAASAAPTGSAGSGYHVVRPGDTVQAVARRYGVDADTLRRANGIVDDQLYVGARLRLSDPNGGSLPSTRISSSTPTSNGSTASGSTYTVREGDVLGRIAERHGVRLSALLAVNDLESDDLIMVGAQLVIPSGSGGSGGSSAGAASGSYTVQDGDVLARIARRHGVSLSALLAANDLESDDLIMEGDRLVIPAGTTAAASSSRDGSSADLVCPVAGASFMNDWGFPRGSTRFHEGTDLFAPSGTTIVAPASGSVSFGSNRLGGTTFTLSTDGGWVFYGAHLDDTIGSSGRVSAGTPIGVVGDSGNAAGGDPHLHLGMKPAGGQSINPYPSIAAACG